MLEITGQPCAGKSTMLRQMATNENVEIIRQTARHKIKHFILGYLYLGAGSASKLLSWSLRESVPLFFRINIFFNAVAKFGVIKNKRADGCIDEGVSHLPFLFLNTDSDEVIEHILPQLRYISVRLILAPDQRAVAQRLRDRGHKRLRYISLDRFVKRNYEIEQAILFKYPSLCRTFRAE